jgi:hypothetical protein
MMMLLSGKVTFGKNLFLLLDPEDNKMTACVVKTHQCGGT